MPELPEVEVVKRSLEKKARNLIIKKVKINDGNLRYKVNKYQILKLRGRRIKKIERRSKYLIFTIHKDTVMLVHLGMTGKFFFIDKMNKRFKTSFYYKLDENKDTKFNRVIFFLQNNQKIIYNDIRKFGFIKLYNSNEFEKNLHFRKLGPEPLSNKFNSKYLKNYFSNRKRTVKDILMDQKCVAGLGNIYVNEILYLSKIKPFKNVKKISNNEITKLILNTKKVLEDSIKLGGSSIKNFSSGDGKKGTFQQFFKVYGRKGEKCTNIACDSIIQRTTISNRATFFCEKCQK